MKNKKHKITQNLKKTRIENNKLNLLNSIMTLKDKVQILL